ncbi:MAG: 23S rRNA (pseudouridine(1915)-N(3))-methyltransferase RlmH [Pseudomonadota bacterium]
MRLLVLEVTRGRTPWADEAARLYLERIGRMARIEERSVRPADPARDVARAREDEGLRLLAGVRPGDHLVVLDERGAGLSTDGFRDLLALGDQPAVDRLVFLLGGAHGHAESTRARARTLLALSPLVLNHQVARVVLLEQIYRGLTLLKGVPYHH